MTFTPSVQSKVDTNNSSATQLLLNGTFTGNGTCTTGYDTLIVTVTTNVDSAAGGLEIQFSDDNVVPYQTFATDTVLATGTFTRTYLVVKKWYRVKYTTTAATTTFDLTTRMSVNLDSSITTNATSINVFDNAVEASLDAFGKQRVTQPTTLLDIRFPRAPTASAQIRSNNLMVNTYAGGAGYSVAALGDGQLTLNATGAAAGIVVSSSRTYATYQPGKSLLMLCSGLFKPANDTYTSAVGLFNAFPLGVTYIQTGVYLSFTAGVAAFNIAVDGVVTMSAPQSAWNLDQMNGTGPSGLTLDFTKCQLLVIDLEWLGVGRIRYGFYAYGRPQYCHQVTNINALIGPYTPTMNLPVTFLLYNTGAPAVASRIVQVCSTIISEGGYNPVGRPFSANTGNNETTEAISVKADQQYPLIAIRGNVTLGYFHQTIVPTAFNVLTTGANDIVLYRLWYYPSPYPPNNPVAANWYNANSQESLVQYAPGVYYNGATIVQNFTLPIPTGTAVLIHSGYVQGKGSNALSGLSNEFTTLLLSLHSDLFNVPDILLLTAQRVGSGATTAQVWASLDWQEVY